MLYYQAALLHTTLTRRSWHLCRYCIQGVIVVYHQYCSQCFVEHNQDTNPDDYLYRLAPRCEIEMHHYYPSTGGRQGTEACIQVQWRGGGELSELLL